MDVLDHRLQRLKGEPIRLSGVRWSDQQYQISSSNGSQVPCLEKDVEYRQVLCEGVFDNDKSMYVGPRPRTISGNTRKGYVLVTPLYPAGNRYDSSPCMWLMSSISRN